MKICAWNLLLLAVVVIIFVAMWCNIYIHFRAVRINIFTAYYRVETIKPYTKLKKSVIRQ